MDNISIELWFGTLIFVSMEPICMEIPLCLSCVGKILLEMLLVGRR